MMIHVNASKTLPKIPIQVRSVTSLLRSSDKLIKTVFLDTSRLSGIRSRDDPEAW